MDLLRNSGLIARSIALQLSSYYPERHRQRQFVEQLESRRVDAAFDIGANTGQYSSGLRRAGFTGRIISFEPLSESFSVLQRNVAGDPLWDCERYAIGDSDGAISINVAGNSGESSSVLPMLKSHQDAYPPANYVGTEEVSIRRLDTLAPSFLKKNDVLFLKIDVQGFEKQVLAGGAATVRDHCVGMQLELSFLPLYEGGMLINEALDLVYSMGFVLTGLAPCFIDPRTGQTLQVDGTFFRPNS